MKSADLKHDELYYVDKSGLWDNCAVVDARMWVADRYTRPARIRLRSGSGTGGGRNGIIMVTTAFVGEPDLGDAERKARVARLPEVARELRRRVAEGSPLPAAPDGYQVALVQPRSIEGTQAEHEAARERRMVEMDQARVRRDAERVLEQAAEDRLKAVLGVTFVYIPRTYIELEKLLEEYASQKAARASS